MATATLPEILAALALAARLARQYAHIAHMHAEFARRLVSL
jgi:hypothetical protein